MFKFLPNSHMVHSGPAQPARHSQVPVLEHLLVLEHDVSSQNMSQCCLEIQCNGAHFNVRGANACTFTGLVYGWDIARTLP